jgi:hypothetical protein
MDTTITNNLLWIGVLAAILAIVVAFAGLRSRRNITRAAQSSLDRLPEIRCPRCGQQMEEGFVAIGGMSWRAFTSPPRKVTGSGEMLENTGENQVSQIFSQGVPENRAHRCTLCKLVLVDHSQLYVLGKR